MAKYKFKNIDFRKCRLASGEVRTYLYHRKTRKRLPDVIDSHAFLVAYTGEEEKSHISVDRNKGTFKELIQRYVESPEYGKLRPRSKKDYRDHIKAIENRFGDLPVAALDDAGVRRHFLKWRDELGNSSKRQADYAIAVLRRVLSCSRSRGYILYNHAEQIAKLDASDRSQKVWTQDNIEAFIHVAHIEIAFALVLAVETGQRQGDLLALTWGAYADGVLTVNASKTGVTVYVPVTNKLRGWFDRIKAHRESMGVNAITILADTKGLPWQEHSFRRNFRAARNKAGISELTFHDLRGTCVTNLADAGATHHEIASITGHSLRSIGQILDKYSARTKKQSRSAIRKLEQARVEENAK